MAKSLLSGLAGFMLVGSLCGPAAEVPAPTRWVTDNSGLLTGVQQDALSERLRAYKARTQHHVIVYITPTTGGEPPAEWCPRMFNRWGIGREGHDDGVVLFVFTRDDARWITVGYGLERALPDRECSRIVRELVRPGILGGDPARGINDGVTAILAAIDSWEKTR